MTASRRQLVESNAELTKFNKAHEFYSYPSTPSWTAPKKVTVAMPTKLLGHAHWNF
jgi:hypothetical protein